MTADAREVPKPEGAVCVADFSVSDEAFEYFKAEAAKRRVPVARLCRKLMDVIAKDRMVDAILDDQT
jgi:hypothetical protein